MVQYQSGAFCALCHPASPLQLVWASCIIRPPRQDFQVKKSTNCDGLGIRPRGNEDVESMHLGAPLFNQAAQIPTLSLPRTPRISVPLGLLSNVHVLRSDTIDGETNIHYGTFCARIYIPYQSQSYSLHCVWGVS